MNSNWHLYIFQVRKNKFTFFQVQATNEQQQAFVRLSSKKKYINFLSFHQLKLRMLYGCPDPNKEPLCNVSPSSCSSVHDPDLF
jgi:hypothetical protein